MIEKWTVGDVLEAELTGAERPSDQLVQIDVVEHRIAFEDGFGRGFEDLLLPKTAFSVLLAERLDTLSPNFRTLDEAGGEFLDPLGSLGIGGVRILDRRLVGRRRARGLTGFLITGDSVVFRGWFGPTNDRNTHA